MGQSFRTSNFNPFYVTMLPFNLYPHPHPTMATMKLNIDGYPECLSQAAAGLVAGLGATGGHLGSVVRTNVFMTIDPNLGSGHSEGSQDTIGGVLRQFQHEISYFVKLLCF